MYMYMVLKYIDTDLFRGSIVQLWLLGAIDLPRVTRIQPRVHPFESPSAVTCAFLRNRNIQSLGLCTIILFVLIYVCIYLAIYLYIYHLSSAHRTLYNRTYACANIPWIVRSNFRLTETHRWDTIHFSCLIRYYIIFKYHTQLINSMNISKYWLSFIYYFRYL